MSALHAFARLVHDTAADSPGDRVAILNLLEADADRLYRFLEPIHPVMRGIADTVWACGVPPERLLELIDVNRRATWQPTFATFDDVVADCERFAAPAGRLALHVFDAATPARLALSDALCLGGQVVEQCRSVVEDLADGRVRIPADDMRRFGCTIADLSASVACTRVRRLIAFECTRARRQLVHGAPLVRTLRGRPALAVGGFLADALAALAAIERVEYDVLARRPRALRIHRLAARLVSVRRLDGAPLP